jgi:hypothetical protein
MKNIRNDFSRIYVKNAFETVPCIIFTEINLIYNMNMKFSHQATYVVLKATNKIN